MPEVQEQAPIMQESIKINESISLINLQKCTNCTFENKIPRILKKHLNSIIQCSKCPKTFCGRRAKVQYISHEKNHEIKPKKAKNAHICHVCSKCYQYESKLKQHLTWSACGRK